MRGTRERRDERKGRGSSTEGKTNTKAQRQQRGQESEKCRDTARKTKKLSAAGSDSSCGLQCREVSTGPPAALKIRQAYTCTSDGQTDDMCPHTHTQCGQSAAPWPRALHALSRVAPLWPPCPSKAVSAGHISAFSEKRGPHGVTLPDSHFRRLVSNNDLSCIIKQTVAEKHILCSVLDHFSINIGGFTVIISNKRNNLPVQDLTVCCGSLRALLQLVLLLLIISTKSFLNIFLFWMTT